MTNKSTFTRDEIRAMSEADRVERIDELNEALADGRITAGGDAA